MHRWQIYKDWRLEHGEWCGRRCSCKHAPAGSGDVDDNRDGRDNDDDNGSDGDDGGSRDDNGRRRTVDQVRL